jgi:hypothetical protein
MPMATTPVNGGGKIEFNRDPYWRDLVLFYEYFHGDPAADIGASHQTGWAGLVARLIHLEGGLGKTPSPNQLQSERQSSRRSDHSRNSSLGRSTRARYVAVNPGATIV